MPPDHRGRALPALRSRLPGPAPTPCRDASRAAGVARQLGPGAVRGAAAPRWNLPLGVGEVGSRWSWARSNGQGRAERRAGCRAVVSCLRGEQIGTRASHVAHRVAGLPVTSGRHDPAVAFPTGTLGVASGQDLHCPTTASPQRGPGRHQHGRHGVGRCRSSNDGLASFPSEPPVRMPWPMTISPLVRDSAAGSSAARPSTCTGRRPPGVVRRRRPTITTTAPSQNGTRSPRAASGPPSTPPSAEPGCSGPRWSSRSPAIPGPHQRRPSAGAERE
jgi:hypothetical protein